MTASYFTVAGERIPLLAEEPVRSLGRTYMANLIDKSIASAVTTQRQDGLRNIDQCPQPRKFKLLDELPMIYSTCVFVYCLYECFKHGNSISWFPVALLFIFSITVTVVYLEWKEPVFHQVMYGALVACLVIRSVFIVTWVYPWLQPLCYTSLGVFLLGFLLWNIDNIFCDSLRASRQTLPPGVGVVTQFHAWWHIFTGLGSYLHILLSMQIRTTYLKYGPKVKFRPSKLVLFSWRTALSHAHSDSRKVTNFML
ncbi:alkaline ceramidase 3 isoform X4 [Festucalex cinctus]